MPRQPQNVRCSVTESKRAMLFRLRGYSRFVFDFEGRLGLVFPLPAIRTSCMGFKTIRVAHVAALLFCSLDRLVHADQRALFQLIVNLVQPSHHVSVLRSLVSVSPFSVVRQPCGEQYIQTTEYRVDYHHTAVHCLCVSSHMVFQGTPSLLTASTNSGSLWYARIIVCASLRKAARYFLSSRLSFNKRRRTAKPISVQKSTTFDPPIQPDL